MRNSMMGWLGLMGSNRLADKNCVVETVSELPLSESWDATKLDEPVGDKVLPVPEHLTASAMPVVDAIQTKRPYKKKTVATDEVD